MVGGFVEDEDVWVGEGEAGECDAGFLSAGEEFHSLEAGHACYSEAVGGGRGFVSEEGVKVGWGGGRGEERGWVVCLRS